MSRETCDKCGGTGKINYRTPGDLEPTQLTEDTTIQNIGGWSTRACSCVRDLPATDGHATWWESETIYSAVVDVPIGAECIEVKAECEVPRGDDGRRYHRTADNSYFPPLVELEFPRPGVMLHAEDARKFAAALIAAADACDKADELSETV
jgi:hypothetical protein